MLSSPWFLSLFKLHLIITYTYALLQVYSIIDDIIALVLFTVGIYMFYREFKPKTQPLAASPQTRPAIAPTKRVAIATEVVRS